MCVCTYRPPTTLLTKSISAGSQISACFELAPEMYKRLGAYMGHYRKHALIGEVLHILMFYEKKEILICNVPCP